MILDTLLRAENNLRSHNEHTRELGIMQLHNVIVLLQKGFPLETELITVLWKYKNIDDVPDYKPNE